MIGDIPVILILGIFNFLLILFQLSTGMRWIRVSFRAHRKSGILLLILASIHALLGILT